VATVRAEALAPRARELLLEVERFAASGELDPAKWRTTFVIVGNDLPRDALLPAPFSRLRKRPPGVALSVINANLPAADMLRQMQGGPGGEGVCRGERTGRRTWDPGKRAMERRE
jgi:DNA-binding transcriptional LysR family regulator